MTTTEHSFRDELTSVLNLHNRENQSGTPDFILAEYMLASLAAFDAATQRRDNWWGFVPMIGGSVPAVGPLEAPVGVRGPDDND